MTATVGLAEGIPDDTYVLSHQYVRNALFLFKKNMQTHCNFQNYVYHFLKYFHDM